MNVIKVIEKKDCCGCSSCAQKCPTNAISMKENEEGFLYPEIDTEKCVNCGLCTNVCPQLKSYENNIDKKNIAYAMYCKDKNVISKSSSGGIFSVIAKYVIDKNGIVFGAAYNDNLVVNHIAIEKEEEIDKLRTSKYVQSDINNTYKEAERALRNNRLVMFVGTPCQISGLKSFLLKEYDNLITVDFVCHGVPSPKLFSKYIGYLSKKYKSEVLKYNFRNKEAKGWALVSKVETKDGRTRFRESCLDPYYNKFLKSTTYRESCYQCHYANCSRISDITLGDYFAIKKVKPEFYNNDGVSLVIVNSTKGMDIVRCFLDNINYIETDIEVAAKYNENLVKPSHRPDERNNIYNDINSLSDYEFVRKNMKIEMSFKKFLQYVIPFKIKKKFKK